MRTDLNAAEFAFERIKHVLAWINRNCPLA
jgi:hypothetical protein